MFRNLFDSLLTNVNSRIDCGNKGDAINFSLLHLHARSLLKNIDKFTQLLDSSQHEFSAIGISETWLNNVNEDYININGCRFISSNRVGGIGGGAGLYLSDTFNFNIMFVSPGKIIMTANWIRLDLT